MIVVALCAVFGGVGGLLAPTLIRAIPEPVSELPAAAASEPLPAAAGDGDSMVVEASAPPEPKIAYAQIADRPGLGLWTAAVSAVAAATLGWSLGASWFLAVFLPLVPVLVALSVVDWHTRLLPTWVIRPTYYMTIVLVCVVAALSGEWRLLAGAALGWLAMGAFYFVLWFINSGGLGYGDVRLSGILGLALGTLGWAEVLTGAWAGFLLGGVLGGLLALAKIVDRRGVPFGPFMVAGALLGVVLGPWVGLRFG